MIGRELLSSELLLFLDRAASSAILRSPLSFHAGRRVRLRPAAFEVMASHSREASHFGSRSRRRRAGKGISRNARRSSFFQFAFTRNRSDSVAMRRSVAILSWNLALPPTRTVLMTIGAVDVSFPLPSPCGIANETRCCRLHNFTSNGYSCVERGHSCTTRDACLVFCSLYLSLYTGTS